jgi:hypothetical protein
MVNEVERYARACQRAKGTVVAIGSLAHSTWGDATMTGDPCVHSRCGYRLSRSECAVAVRGHTRSDTTQQLGQPQAVAGLPKVGAFVIIHGYVAGSIQRLHKPLDCLPVREGTDPQVEVVCAPR